MRLIHRGARMLAGGARRGNALLSGLGAALLVVGWLRRRGAPGRRLLYARTLRPGEALRIRLVGSDEEATIEG
jgi:hypothetical protein